MNKPLLFLVILFVILFPVDFLQAQEEIKQPKNECPYGNYLPSSKSGWYGARRVVSTPDDARIIVEHFFMHQPHFRVGKIIAKQRFYVAEIVNIKGKVVDLILIDRLTGRIRSMY